MLQAKANIEAAGALIASRAKERPRVLLVLGSGLGSLAERVEGIRIPYEDIPHFPRVTVEGHAGYLAVGRLNGVSVAALSGRFHYYEGYGLDDVTFFVRVLASLGAKTMLVTNAAGGVNKKFKVGDLMLLTDHINFLGANPLRGANVPPGPRFPDMSTAYDPALRKIALDVAKKEKIKLRQGIYVASMGPCYETPAEIRMARTLGADAVGMSTVPEVIAARHMGIRVLGLSCITNMAAGVTKQKLDHREVLEIAEKAKAGLLEVLGRIIAEAAKPA